MEDFICSACGGGLPGFPVHGHRGTYCCTYCRDWAEPDTEPAPEDDEEE